MKKTIYITASTCDNDITVCREDRSIWQMVENCVDQYNLYLKEEGLEEPSTEEVARRIADELKKTGKYETLSYTFFYTGKHPLNGKPAITFKWWPENDFDRFVEVYIEEEA